MKKKTETDYTIEGIEITDFKCYLKLAEILHDEVNNSFKAFISSHSRKKSMVKMLGEIIII